MQLLKVGYSRLLQPTHGLYRGLQFSVVFVKMKAAAVPIIQCIRECIRHEEVDTYPALAGS